MFDRSVIETDAFLNVSMSAKALYFLLGMEADDEGFISPNRVLRLYGGEMGDIKNLIDVGLIIPFQSGVIVITNWNDNNYLDKNRIKPTKYQDEKKMLSLTDNGKYVLNTGLTVVQPVERRVEESRGEELPDWLDRNTWDEWKQHRKEKKKALTPLSIKKQIKFLSEDIAHHKDIINRSIQNGWTGLFPLTNNTQKKMYVA